MKKYRVRGYIYVGDPHWKLISHIVNADDREDAIMAWRKVNAFSFGGETFTKYKIKSVERYEE